MREAKPKQDKDRQIPSDEPRYGTDCENRIEAAAGGVVGLRRKETCARRGIAEEKAVDDHEAKRAAKPKPKERPTHAAEREEKREANNRENHAETDARATRERKRKPRREREDAPSKGRWTGEGQKEEANRHEKRRKRVCLGDCNVVEMVEVRAKQEKDGESGKRTAARRDKASGDSTEKRKPQRTKDDCKDSCAKEPEGIPYRRKRRIHDRHDRCLGVEEVAIRGLALRHETRGIKIPSLILIEGPKPHGRKRKHDEPEGRQKPISLHRAIL